MRRHPECDGSQLVDDMERTDSINLKTLNLDELAGVVNLYPWYGAARRELCIRMARMGGDAWDPEQYADAALYLGNRREIRDIATPSDRADYADKDLEKLLRAYISEETEEEETEAEAEAEETEEEAEPEETEETEAEAEEEDK